MTERMTEIECMERMILLWGYLRKYPKAYKVEAYTALRLSPDRHYCPCCEYTLDNNISLTTCEECPLLEAWPQVPADITAIGMTIPPCGRLHSIYNEWSNTEDPATRKYYADKIVNASKIRLGKLLKEQSKQQRIDRVNQAMEQNS